MKKCVGICVLIMLLITACGGGGGGSGGLNNENLPEALTELIPLNVSITDLNDNPIPYIDVSLVGSHTEYKLKFTNPNHIAVTVPNPRLLPNSEMFFIDSFSDQNWLYSQAGVTKISAARKDRSYFDSSNPGVGEITDEFNKTTNVDDCLNTQSIAPGGSCSFYAYAYNMGLGYAKNATMFSYPLAYLIKSLDGKKSLVVQQCTYRHSYGEDEVSYNCANETRPGYANQFITYKMNSKNTGITNLYIDTFRGRGAPVISNDGNWFYSCRIQLSISILNQVVCDKYAITYQNNILTKASTPTTTVSMPDQIGAGNTIEQIYPSLDGNNAWIALYNKQTGYSLLYTQTPGIAYWDYCFNNTPCAPFISTTQNMIGNHTGLIGLDGSFWWNTNVGADVYVPTLGTFVETNASGVLGVDATGVVVSVRQEPANSRRYIGVCYRTESGTNGYTEQEVLNYKYPDYGTRVRSMDKYVYLQMPVSGFVDALGNKIAAINADFRVHTENGLCEIQLDDYTFAGGETSSKYTVTTMSYGQSSGNFSVMPSSNMYFGK